MVLHQIDACEMLALAEAAAGVLESFVHRYHWRMMLTLGEVVVWIEVERPSAALPLRSLQ